MPKIDVKVPFMKNQLSTLQNGIIIYLYNDIDSEEHEQYIHIEEFDKTFSVEELCLKAADISRLDRSRSQSLLWQNKTLFAGILQRKHSSAGVTSCEHSYIALDLFHRSHASARLLVRIKARSIIFFIRSGMISQWSNSVQVQIVWTGACSRFGCDRHAQICKGTTDRSRKLLRLEPQNFIPKTAKSGFKFFWG